jgi:hypothetical protein
MSPKSLRIYSVSTLEEYKLNRHREPNVGERLREGAAELPPGLQALQGAWGSRDVSYVVGSQDGRFGLQVALVVSLDPPSKDSLVLFC